MKKTRKSVRISLSVVLLLTFISLGVWAAPLTPDTDLSLADAIFQGEGERDSAGGAVASLGDVNGDGLPDFAVAAANNDEASVNAGQVYVFFGKPEGWDPLVNLAQADASFLGERDRAMAGGAIAGAGDVNGDHIDDILIGAPTDGEAGDKAGQVYLIFGKQSGWAMDTSLSQADASFLGENPGDKAGFAVSGVGDTNGDGLDDLLIDASQNSDSGYQAGQVYLVLGKESGWATDTSLSQADASFLSAQVRGRMEAVAGGDVNGDGLADLLIGAWRLNTIAANCGEVFVILGKESGWAMRTPLVDSDASFTGELLGNWAGYSVASAGDVNGDGLADILIGAPGDDDHGRQAGEAYLVLGKTSGWAMGTSLSQADASFRPEWTYNRIGTTVSGAGDVNQDGLDDFIINAVIDDQGGMGAGRVYLILGQTSGWAQNTELVDAPVTFWGEEGGDHAGTSLASLGDVNSDGFADILIGAPDNDAGGEDAGRAYLLLGDDRPAASHFAPDRPFGGVGNYHTFSASYYDLVDGWGDLKHADLQIQGHGPRVIARYAPERNRLSLWEKGLGWIDTCRLGRPATIAGSYLELDCASTTVTNDGGGELTVAWRLRVVEPVSVGYTLDFSLVAWDKDRQSSGEQPGGAWKIDPDSHEFDLDRAEHSFLGEAFSDQAGWSVASAGDLNSDGYGDLLVGAPNNADSQYNGGQVYVFLGNASGWGPGVSLDGADASYIAEDGEDYAGFSVAGVGDVNADGFDDFAIGAYNSIEVGAATGGQVYLILGKGSNWTTETSLSLADASFLTEYGASFTGFTVSAAGDVNGDGYDDFLIGAWGNRDGGGNNAGQGYLILGKEDGWAMDTSLGDSDASFIGEAQGDWASYALAKAGDVNNDGFDDLLIGAPNRGEGSASAGQVYLFLGKASGWLMDIPLAQADASFLGEDSGDQAGMALAGGGDVNGDGYDDFFVTALGDEEGNGRESGQVYLILGKESGWQMDTSLSLADASFLGEHAYDWAGAAVSLLGDLNGDGYDDFAISAPGNDDGGMAAGKVYVVLGRDSGWTMHASLADAHLAYWGEAPRDRAGKALAGCTDVLGAGSVSLLIGAPGQDVAGVHNVGKAYHIVLRDAEAAR